MKTLDEVNKDLARIREQCRKDEIEYSDCTEYLAMVMEKNKIIKYNNQKELYMMHYRDVVFENNNRTKSKLTPAEMKEEAKKRYYNAINNKREDKIC
ncbi:MAG: hypothetical protein ACRCRT_06755 [Cetobacterium somerae]